MKKKQLSKNPNKMVTKVKPSSLIADSSSNETSEIKQEELQEKQINIQKSKKNQIVEILEKNKQIKEYDQKMNKKEKEGMKIMSLYNNNIGQLSQKFNEFNIEAKHNSQMQLNLCSIFESDQILLKFQSEFIKIVKQIKYLNWTILGYFKDKGQAKAIGEMIGKLQNTYRLDLSVKIHTFSDSGFNSLVNGLRKLKNLHILHLTLPDHTKELNHQDCENLRQCLLSLPNLEIFTLDKIQNFNTNGILKLSNTNKDIFQYYNLSQENNITEVEYLTQNMNEIISSFNKDLENNKNLIVQIKFQLYISEHQDLELVKLKSKLYIKSLLCCFQLPYLTEFDTYYPDRTHYTSINQYSYLLHEITFQKLKAILQIQIYDYYYSDWQITNPKMILADLWID